MASYPLQSESQSFSSFLTRPFKEYSLSTHCSPLLPTALDSLQYILPPEVLMVPPSLSSGLSLYAPFLVRPDLVIPPQHSLNPLLAFFCRNYYPLKFHVFYLFIFCVSSVPLESSMRVRIFTISFLCWIPGAHKSACHTVVAHSINTHR